METGDSLEHDEGWESVKKLIELAKSAHDPRRSAPSGASEFVDGPHQRLERDRFEPSDRQRTRPPVAGAFVAGASTTPLAGSLLKLVSGGGLPGLGLPRPRY